MHRGKQLEELGFERNDEQLCFTPPEFKKQSTLIDFRDIYEYSEQEWDKIINTIKNE